VFDVPDDLPEGHERFFDPRHAPDVRGRRVARPYVATRRSRTRRRGGAT
jgi:hypothetical protein